EKGAPRIRIVDVLAQRDDRIVDLVVARRDAACAVAKAEMHDDRGYVVRKPAIVLASLPECVTNHHVREERQGRMRAARVSNQRGRQARVVENRVDSLVGETLLEHTELLARVASENAGRELRVVPRELMTSVGENHLPSLSPSHTREYRRV